MRAALLAATIVLCPTALRAEPFENARWSVMLQRAERLTLDQLIDFLQMERIRR